MIYDEAYNVPGKFEIGVFWEVKCPRQSWNLKFEENNFEVTNLNWRDKRAFMQCIATASVEFHEAVKMDLLLNLASALLRGTDWKSIRTQEIV